MSRSTSSAERHRPDAVVSRGRHPGPKPPLTPAQVWAIRAYLERDHRARDLALFDLAIDSKLRGCDLVQLRIADVVARGEPRRRALIMLKNTVQPIQFELTDRARTSLSAWLELRVGASDGYVFPGRTDRNGHLGTRQYARLIGEWVQAIGLDPMAYGTHSLRRTKVTILFRRTGNLHAVQILLGHRRLESTVRYLGVDRNDPLAMSEATEI